MTRPASIANTIHDSVNNIVRFLDFESRIFNEWVEKSEIYLISEGYVTNKIEKRMNAHL